MNERIRELAHEAGLPTYNPDGIPTKLEKFAELIVRECIDIISLYAIRMENFDGGHPIAEIKQHFGVE
jgi:hypothetical protein